MHLTFVLHDENKIRLKIIIKPIGSFAFVVIVLIFNCLTCYYSSFSSPNHHQNPMITKIARIVKSIPHIVFPLKKAIIAPTIIKANIAIGIIICTKTSIRNLISCFLEKKVGIIIVLIFNCLIDDFFRIFVFFSYPPPHTPYNCKDCKDCEKYSPYSKFPYQKSNYCHNNNNRHNKDKKDVN